MIERLKLNREGLSLQRRVRMDLVERIFAAVALIGRIDKTLSGVDLTGPVRTTLEEYRIGWVDFLDSCRRDHGYLFERISGHELVRRRLRRSVGANE